MSEFSIQLNNMNAAIDANRSLADRLASASDTVARIKNGLTFELRQRSRIDSRLRQAAEELEGQSAALNRAADTAAQVVGLYTKTERAAAGIRSGGMSWASAAGSTAVLPEGGKTSSWVLDWLAEENKQWDDSKTFVDWVETFLKLDKDGIGGFLGEGVSYIDAFLDLFGGDVQGVSGAKAICNLFDKSVSLWKSGYDYLKDFYHEAGNFFGKGGQAIVEGLGLAGASVGALTEYLDALDFQDKGIGKIVSGFVDFAKASVPVVESAYKLDHIKDVASLATDKLGPYSALGIYGSIGEAALSFISQTSESIDRYSKDGVWDSKDTAYLLVDSSVSGIYGLANGLTFGLLDVAMDGLNMLTGGQPLAEGETYADRASEGLKAGAEWLGKAIGYKILDIRKALGW